MEELRDLMKAKVDLEDKTSFLANERRVMEEDLDKRENNCSERLHEVNMKIHNLHNKLGAHLILCSYDEKALRHELVAIERILSMDNDKSQIVLSYEEPTNRSFSIHIDMIYYVVDMGFNITIKTKCPAVERIVRETLCCQDPTVREWYKSRVIDSEITFKRKSACRPGDIEDTHSAAP